MQLIAILFIMVTFVRADPMPFPSEQLWQIELNRMNILGPSWLEDGEVHFLIWKSPYLIEISNGRIIEEIRTGDVSVRAIIKADCHENEGDEILMVNVPSHTRSTIKILEAGTYELLESFSLQNFGKISNAKWIGGDNGLIILFTEWLEYGQANSHSYTGSALLYSLYDGEIINSASTGTPPNVSYWREDGDEIERILTGGQNVAVGGNRGFYFVNSNTLISTMSLELDNYRQQVPSEADANYNDGDPYPGTYTTAVQIGYTEERGNVAFIAIYDNQEYTLIGYSLPELRRFGRWDLEGRPVVAMASFDNIEVDQPRNYLLCFDNSNIRLFDLLELQFNPQEYISPVGNEWIRIEDFDGDGNMEMIGFDGDYLTYVRTEALLAPGNPKTVTLPKFYNISSYPNPFNLSTTINYQLPQTGQISLHVLNPLGQQIGTLFEGYKTAGVYSTILTTDNLPTGLYFVQLRASGQKFTNKIVFTK